MKYTIFCDGGSLNNQSAKDRSAYLSYKVNDDIYREKDLGKLTNNEAEYRSLISSLNFLLDNRLQNNEVIINMDSALVVNQVNGNWKIKSPSLIKLNKVSKNLVDKFPKLILQWIDNLKMKQVLGH